MRKYITASQEHFAPPVNIAVPSTYPFVELSRVTVQDFESWYCRYTLKILILARCGQIARVNKKS